MMSEVFKIPFSFVQKYYICNHKQYKTVHIKIIVHERYPTIVLRLLGLKVRQNLDHTI